MKKSIFLSVLFMAVAMLIFIVCKNEITGPEGLDITEPLSLISPAYGSILNGGTVELEWHSEADAGKYEVTVDNSNDFTSPEFSSTDVQDTMVTTGELNAGVYYWRARAENGGWSNVWMFTISTNNAAAPAGISPANGAAIYEEPFTLDWNNVNNAMTYELQIDNSSGFSNPEIQKDDLSDSDFICSEGLEPDLYFWRVRGIDRTGNPTVWSDPWWFFYKYVADVDGNIYKTVTICDQVWMAENLACRHYRDGSPIFHAIYEADWDNLADTEMGGYSSYTNQDALIDPYGLLYNWYAVVDARNIAPEGWRVPTDDDFKNLEICLGMEFPQIDYLNWRTSGESEGGKLKETGTVHWLSPNEGATNESGFTALAAGFRDPFVYQSSGFTDLGYYGYFWTSTDYDLLTAWMRCLSYTNTGIYRNHYIKNDGFSVRLIKE